MQNTAQDGKTGMWAQLKAKLFRSRSRGSASAQSTLQEDAPQMAAFSDPKNPPPPDGGPE